MDDQPAARILNIPMKAEVKKTGVFTSAVSATAIISLFVVLMVQLLENLR